MNIEFSLQRANLLTERRLLDAKPLGCPGDMPFFGDGDKVAKVSEFHPPYPLYMDNSLAILWISGLAKAMPFLRHMAGIEITPHGLAAEPDRRPPETVPCAVRSKHPPVR